MTARAILDGLISEAELQRTVVQLARARGWLVCHMTDPQRSEPGVPDLLMVRPPRVVFMELKRQKGRLDRRTRHDRKGRVLPNQEDWKLALETCGGVEYYLFRPSDWDTIAGVIA